MRNYLTAGATEEEPVAAKLARVYDAIQEERVNQTNWKPISARELARRANVSLVLKGTSVIYREIVAGADQCFLVSS